MVKDIVIVADLGAAGNLVRNLLLLSNDVDWPWLTESRLHTVLGQYQTGLTLDLWLEKENKLRFWNHYYGVDISNHIDIEKFCFRKTLSKPVVYLNHSAFYQPDEYQKLQPIITKLYVAPTTDFGRKWQVRSYCEKKTVSKLHNFTFDHNVTQQTQDFCLEHGAEAFYRLNIQNFFQISSARQLQFGEPDLALEYLLHDSAEKIVAIIGSITGIAIPLDHADKVLTAWRNLHWPLDQTYNWKYHDCTS